MKKVVTVRRIIINFAYFCPQNQNCLTKKPKRMKRRLFLFLLFGFLLATTQLFAQNGGGGHQGDDPPHLSPQLNPFIVSYDSVFNSVSIMFRDSIEQATVIINKDGILLDEESGYADPYVK